MQRMAANNVKTSSSAPAPKSVSAERPVLLSTAKVAEFIAWEEAWRDYAQCQCLASHDRHTRMSAFSQALDEDLRRFIREGSIAFPDNADIADAIPVLQHYIRRQKNPLLDRIEFYKRRQQRGESLTHFIRPSVNCFMPVTVLDVTYVTPATRRCVTLARHPC